jgi:hypothetical protein
MYVPVPGARVMFSCRDGPGMFFLTCRMSVFSIRPVRSPLLWSSVARRFGGWLVWAVFQNTLMKNGGCLAWYPVLKIRYKDIDLVAGGA